MSRYVIFGQCKASIYRAISKKQKKYILVNYFLYVVKIDKVIYSEFSGCC